MGKTFDRIVTKTKNTVSSNRKVQALLTLATEKLSNAKQDEKLPQKFLNEILLIVAMIRDHFTGRYKAFSGSTIFMFVLGLVYFITPVDVIPDFIPVLGFTDDIALVLYILKKFREDINEYRDWKEGMG